MNKKGTVEWWLGWACNELSLDCRTSDGKLIGAPQVALKVPFTFPLSYHGNAYDVSRDLSTIVYTCPGGHADLYLLSQK